MLFASDGNTKKWLRSATANTRWNESVTPSFHRFLSPQNNTPVITCGIVGGSRSAFAPALHRAVRLQAQHASRHETATVMVPGSDVRATCLPAELATIPTPSQPSVRACPRTHRAFPALAPCHRAALATRAPLRRWSSGI